MNNQLKSKAYMDGVACAVQLLCGIADTYMNFNDEMEDRKLAKVLMQTEMDFGNAIATLSRTMGLPFVKLLPILFSCMDLDVPHSVGKYIQKGNVELMEFYLLGFSIEITDSLDDWEEFLLDFDYIEYNGEEDDEIEFDREKVQQILNEMERSGQE